MHSTPTKPKLKAPSSIVDALVEEVKTRVLREIGRSNEAEEYRSHGPLPRELLHLKEPQRTFNATASKLGATWVGSKTRGEWVVSREKWHATRARRATTVLVLVPAAPKSLEEIADACLANAGFRATKDAR